MRKKAAFWSAIGAVIVAIIIILYVLLSVAAHSIATKTAKYSISLIEKAVPNITHIQYKKLHANAFSLLRKQVTLSDVEITTRNLDTPIMIDSLTLTGFPYSNEQALKSFTIKVSDAHLLHFRSWAAQNLIDDLNTVAQAAQVKGKLPSQDIILNHLPQNLNPTVSATMNYRQSQQLMTVMINASLDSQNTLLEQFTIKNVNITAHSKFDDQGLVHILQNAVLAQSNAVLNSKILIPGKDLSQYHLGFWSKELGYKQFELTIVGNGTYSEKTGLNQSHWLFTIPNGAQLNAKSVIKLTDNHVLTPTLKAILLHEPRPLNTSGNNASLVYFSIRFTNQSLIERVYQAIGNVYFHGDAQKVRLMASGAIPVLVGSMRPSLPAAIQAAALQLSAFMNQPQWIELVLAPKKPVPLSTIHHFLKQQDAEFQAMQQTMQTLPKAQQNAYQWAYLTKQYGQLGNFLTLVGFSVSANKH